MGTQPDEHEYNWYDPHDEIIHDDSLHALRETFRSQPFDPRCGRHPSEIPVYVDYARDYGLSPDAYVRQYEGTYNHENGHFLCDECYIAAGMPSSPTGWKCP